MLENKWAKEGDAILKKFTGAPPPAPRGGPRPPQARGERKRRKMTTRPSPSMKNATFVAASISFPQSRSCTLYLSLSLSLTNTLTGTQSAAPPVAGRAPRATLEWLVCA
jgi:hypothetical protein